MFTFLELHFITKQEESGEIEAWYNDNKQPHREDGPAIQATNGDWEYWLNHGEFHRLDGPAVIIHHGPGLTRWHVGGFQAKTWARFQMFSKCSDADLIALKLKWGNMGMAE